MEQNWSRERSHSLRERLDRRLDQVDARHRNAPDPRRARQLGEDDEFGVHPPHGAPGHRRFEGPP